jgi:hypothetical protein
LVDFEGSRTPTKWITTPFTRFLPCIDFDNKHPMCYTALHIK